MGHATLPNGIGHVDWQDERYGEKHGDFAMISTTSTNDTSDDDSTVPSPTSEDSDDHPVDPGTAPDEVYDRIMSPWRASLRRWILRDLRAETELIAKMQRRIRTPLLDTYFVYTSSLGTHTFFLTCLPMVFFFGFLEVGRGLVFVLSMGVYVSSFIKDLVCVPRPYAPPVTRLTMGSHHLEYGFLSTHSTNSVSIALFLYTYLHSAYFGSDGISGLTYLLSCSFLIFYVFSIVFGRLYCGMHSFTDCATGCILGASVWAVHALWWRPIEDWLVSPHTSPLLGITLPSWTGALLVATACGIMVHRHPQPVEDCPCFEDAIAFVSVVAGVLVALWGTTMAGFDDSHLVSHMPGSPFAIFTSDPTALSNPYSQMLLWWGTALAKLVVGISTVFAWRILAKALAHLALPPLFRMISYKVLPRLVSIHVLPEGSGLPNRRFYTPATEYDGSVPLSAGGDGSLGGLRSIPSVIDLPGTLQEGEYFAEANVNRYGASEGSDGGFKRRKGIKHSHSDKSIHDSPVASNGFDEKRSQESARPKALESAKEDEEVKHYDADVLTKVIVYGGIGIIATRLTPIAFDLLGWGLHP
ncbi:hypothetical protein SCHPADRAFT_857089 [Schizopora paradoxa]|uniref:Phosphatidic acid phosphatase type 2/haloperoxidase domain-containing protein n=1 Tax=Schizopora paradoxa TaxID=27342 RepID=A0A0H2RZ62_9AGAM|nr:hypothetical protein SCHPADRAFT_857089 [Schizopora paradoxa]